MTQRVRTTVSEQTVQILIIVTKSPFSELRKTREVNAVLILGIKRYFCYDQ